MEEIPIDDMRRSISQHNIGSDYSRLIDMDSAVVDDSDILTVHSWQGSCSRRNRW